MSRLTLAAFASGLMVLAAPATATGQSQYRVFLADGTALASFGEWARVDDRVIFSMPLTPDGGPADLHLVSLPVDRVDVPRTERYADAVRASHYAASRGDADFAQFSADVARTLNQIALINDPVQRLATAERARRALADWPGANYGYRAGEVSEMLGVLDEAISGLRASAGGPRFDLTLTTRTVEPPGETLLPAPGRAEMIEHLVTASTLVDSPVEKVSLLQTVMQLVDRAVGILPEALASRLRSTALSGIAEERRIDEEYAVLRTGTLRSATQLTERADVHGVERLRRWLVDTQDRLRQRRPQEVAALVAAVDAHLEASRRLRLQHDRWLMRLDALRAYQRAATVSMTALSRAQLPLEDIRSMAGPLPQRLRPLADRLATERRRLALIEAPPELSAVHAVLRSAFELAENAVQLRRDAIDAADLALARQASSAAAGAVLLLDRARHDLDAALRSPIEASGPPSARPRQP